MDKRGLALVFLTAAISGFSIFLNKFAVAVVSPDVFTTLKNIVVAAMLLCAVLLFNRREISALRLRDWFALVAVGLIGGSLPFILFFRGLALANAATAAFIHKTMFIYVAIFAAIFLREKLSVKLAVAALSILIGNALLLGLTPAFGVGELLIASATLLWAAETVLAKRILGSLSGTTVAFGRMAFGALFLLAYLLLTNQAQFTLSGAQLGWVALTALLLFAYVVTWYAGLKRVTASTATMVLSLSAPITTLLQLSLSPINVLGIILIAAGVALAFSHEVVSVETSGTSC